MKRFRVGLVGADSYTGMELLRLVASHPRLTLTRATSKADAGKTLAEIHPFLQRTELAELIVCAPETKDLAKACDLVFSPDPEVTAQLLELKTRVVDLSPAFRLKDKAVYEEWHKTSHSSPKYLKETVYGIPEINASSIRRARLTANPGSYSTSVILGLLPALRLNLLKSGTIIADSKAGASEAGREACLPNLLCELYDSLRPCHPGSHYQTPEMIQEIQELGKKNMNIIFTPHLLPINRGILTTIYAPLRKGVEEARVRSAYEAGFRRHRWLRFLPEGVYPELRNVRGTMYCDVSLHVDKKAGMLTIITAIDNLCRGSAGQALANANLMLGMPVDIALRETPLTP
ncbi:MAG: N-acetyl-gamma-glutamyl-phosphate reductase [Desulfovibrionaceae bacterium]|nr:N-acetyl-gamma-glutamyl-phosphate reductase [Desulfovibrionaceae bacterium]